MLSSRLSALRLPRLRLLACGAALLLAALPCGAEEIPLQPGRVRGTFSGIEFEYPADQEDLVRALAPRFLAQAEVRAARAPESDLARSAALGPREMRGNRAAYLGHIATMLNLEKVTPLQEECYDAFVGNYERTMLLYRLMRDEVRSAVAVRHVTIWARMDLVKRLQSGAVIAGFSYDPATQKGSADFNLEAMAVDHAEFDALAEQRAKLHRTYQFSYELKDGTETLRGTVSPLGPQAHPAPASAPTAAAPPKSFYFPVIIPENLANLPADELAAKLWDGMGGSSISQMFASMGEVERALPQTDPQFAFLVLHETIETGIIDNYFRGPDRRWFCDGVANYGAWRVIADLHGETVANRVHNLPALLAPYADLREQADLRRWPATENQSDDDQHSRLNTARYLFAERAIALMNERAGNDVLPRLFAEIGKTKPNKVTIKTVEKAWGKLSNVKLDAILAAASQSPAPTAGPANGAPGR